MKRKSRKSADVNAKALFESVERWFKTRENSNNQEFLFFNFMNIFSSTFENINIKNDAIGQNIEFELPSYFLIPAEFEEKIKIYNVVPELLNNEDYIKYAIIKMTDYGKADFFYKGVSMNFNFKNLLDKSEENISSADTIKYEKTNKNHTRNKILLHSNGMFEFDDLNAFIVDLKNQKKLINKNHNIELQRNFLFMKKNIVKNKKWKFMLFINDQFVYDEQFYNDVIKNIINNSILSNESLVVQFDISTKNDPVDYFGFSKWLVDNKKRLLFDMARVFKVELNTKKPDGDKLDGDALVKRLYRDNKVKLTDICLTIKRLIKNIEQEYPILSKINFREIILNAICKIGKELIYIWGKPNIKYKLNISISTLVRSLIQALNYLIFFDDIGSKIIRDQQIMSFYKLLKSDNYNKNISKIKILFDMKKLNDDEAILKISEIEKELNNTTHRALFSKTAGELSYFKYLNILDNFLAEAITVRI